MTYNNAKKNNNNFLWYAAIIIVIALTAIVTKAIIDSEKNNVANSPGERREQLNAVLEACTNNEYSAQCKELQQKYDVTFRYCHNLKKSDGAYADLDTIMNAWYPVVWEGNSSDPPDTHFTTSSSDIVIPSGYYGCSEHMK